MKDELNKVEISVKVSSKIKEIGNRIRCNRIEKHLTQQDLAYYCCSDKCLISEIERGTAKNITLFTLFKIASVLELSEDYLFTGK